MKFLIDTNIFIPLEPARFSDLEAGSLKVTEFARLVSQAGDQLYVHPAQRVDIRRDRDEARRNIREILFNKYPVLPDPPSVSSEVQEALGTPVPESNDWVDQQLIATLKADAIDFLVTEDQGLIKKARRVGLRARVATIEEALSIVKDLSDAIPSPPPAVQSVKAHVLNATYPIFRSLREDYSEFDDWLIKCKRQQRQAWLIMGKGSDYAALCIVKKEDSTEFGLSGKILKICTFKVSDAYNGSRYGELLIKAVLAFATKNRYGMAYLTVFDKHYILKELMKDFGFEETGKATECGEGVLVKRLSFTEEERNSQDSLQFNIRYGPFAVKFKDVPMFIVPIKPEYHRLLFPEAENQLELIPGIDPFGNSIRKAYLSNAVIRKVTSGSNLLFYRSEDLQEVKTLGTVEDTLVSSSPVEIARYVGKRTVYKFKDIENLCQRDVLAVLFRQSLTLENPITLAEFIEKGFLSGPPQSITEIRMEASEWIQARLSR